MEISVKAIKCDPTDKLNEFIQKKVGKLAKFNSDIQGIEVTLKVEKPATALNKLAAISISLPGEDVYVEKTADTFEEAIDQAIPAAEKQLERYKERKG